MFPLIFKPKNNFKMIRIGSKYDGGYLAEIESIKNSNILISMGINNNWEFEKSFSKFNNDISIFSYDNMTDNRFLIKKIILGILSIPNIYYFKRIVKNLINLIDYNIFFTKKNISYERIFLGLSNNPEDQIITLKKIIEDNNLQDKNIFLKIDIEGSEYRFLNELIIFQKNITGLIIEFHDVDLHKNRIIEFINNFSKNISHIHANNYGRFDINGDPTVIEMTFTSNSKKDKIAEVKLPHILDNPNNPLKKEINIKFEK